MTAPDIFALGGRQDELLQLFHQWVESERRAEAYGDEHPEDDDPQYLRLCAVGLELAYQIIATPAKSAVDLAIKAYMLGWHESGRVVGRPAAYRHSRDIAARRIGQEGLQPAA